MIALSIGKASYDITIPMDNYPVENTRLTVKEKLEGSGGAALHVAYLLGRWNTETYFAGTVGYDDFANSIKKELESVNVHTSFLETNYERKTTTSFILANKETTSRTQIMIEPEVYHLKKADFDFVPDIIYSDGFEYTASVNAFSKYQNAITVLGAGLNNADPKEVLALVKYAKYVVFSLDLAESVTKLKVDVTNPQSLLNFYRAVKEKFPNCEIIVTLKSAGVLYSVNDNIQYMPTIAVKEVDRTASGDIFDGAFVYALSRGYDMDKCMRIANIAAGLSTTKYGGNQSVPIISDVVSYYESKFGSLETVVPTGDGSMGQQAGAPALNNQAPQAPLNNPAPQANANPVINPQPSEAFVQAQGIVNNLQGQNPNGGVNPPPGV